MIPAVHLKSVGPIPLERFVTTYTHDYKPFREPRCEAIAAPPLIIPHQSPRETWPIFDQYKTTNSTYGSYSCPQVPSCSLNPGCLNPLGIPAPMFGAPAFVGSCPAEARTQKVGVAKEIRPCSPCEETKGRLHYVCGRRANMLAPCEEVDEPQKNVDVLYEEEKPACPRSTFLWPPVQLSQPMVEQPHVTHRTNAECYDVSAYLRSLEPTVRMKKCTCVKPTPRQCSCVVQVKESHRCSCKMKTIPPCILDSSTLPLAHTQPTQSTQPSRNPQLTEYQDRYSAEWAKPKNQQTVIHHRHHQRL